jgi:transposase
LVARLGTGEFAIFGEALRELTKYDREAYKRRNLIERCINRLKQFRRIATRYEKTARAFVSMLCIAAARLRIKTVNTA